MRLHATLRTVVGFTIAAKFANLGVHTATSTVDKRFGTVETAALVVPEDLTSFVGLVRGVHNAMTDVTNY